jgi:hypothetical protein
MIQLGAGMDVFGFPPLNLIPERDIAGIVAEFPRAAFNKAFKNLLVAYGRKHSGQAGEWDWISPFVKAADAREGLVVSFDDSP